MPSTAHKPKVVIVDDDQDVNASFVNQFSHEFSVTGITVPEQAIDAFDEGVVAGVVDERMPRLSGVDLLAQIKERYPDVVRILLTAYADFDRLAAAINRAGIARFVNKPWRYAEMRQILWQAVEVHGLRDANKQLMRKLEGERDSLKSQKAFLVGREAQGFGALVGTSIPLQKVIAEARRLADATLSVLIQGETGTGKELLARAIHYEGRRRDNLFVPINCAAIPASLLESELFGHRKGAFSGAVADKKGLLEIADNGTLFLDEIGEMPLTLQAHLLRFLQEGELRPLGDTRLRRVDVRIISATNRDLQDEISAGRFREDLYYRLAGFPLAIPPLRERPDDITALATHFLRGQVRAISEDALAALRQYRFPGNVRQLVNEIERAVLLCDSETLEVQHFSDAIGEAETGSGSTLKNQLRGVESRLIQDALRECGNNRTRAAVKLGISYRWLIQRIRDLHLE